MKNNNIIISNNILLSSFFILFFLLLSNAWAEPIFLSKSTVVFPHKFFERNQKDLFKHHYFGGQKVYLPVIINNSEIEISKLKAEIVQLTFSLEVTHKNQPEIIMTPEGQKVILINLPEVKRRTSFELRCKIKKEGQSVWKELEPIKINVYPNDILKPLQEWSKNVQLRLKDRRGVLKKVLKEYNIKFVDYRSVFLRKKDQNVVTLIVEDFEQFLLEKRDLFYNEKMIVFHEKLKTMPQVIVKSYKQGMLVDVHLELLDRLVEDPLRQKAFIEIIQLISESN